MKTTFYLKDKNRENGNIIAKFEIIENDTNKYSISGDCFYCTAWDGKTLNPIQWQYFVGVYLKWDACTHWWFRGEDYLEEDKDPYYHICGSYCFLDYISMMCFIWEVAKKHFVQDCECFCESKQLNNVLEEFNKKYDIVKECKDEKQST